MKIRTQTLFVLVTGMALCALAVYFFLLGSNPSDIQFLLKNTQTDVRPIKLGKIFRTALESPIPGQWTVRTQIPSSASLRFGYGLPSIPENKKPPGVVFRILYHNGQQNQTIFEQTLSEYGKWKEAEVNLIENPPKKGRTQGSKLIFETQMLSSANQEPLTKLRAFWADPLLIDSDRPPQDRPNIILVSIDTLRADHLHCYGYHRKDISPFMDSLAEKGILFEQAISQCPWTTPSHASIFTGLYPSSHGVNQTIFLLLRARSSRKINVTYQGLDPNIPTIASQFREKNYVTQGFCGGGTVSGDIGFAHS
ncbi:MAG: sulfatase-like hydrolase/transferase, partial [Candidatus Aminicenantes bacterium]|nr:sulfatase-like hydrolase/transferase [Candidatus Aminicenantes bacterium]